jgi:hypothetical protein
VIFAQSASFQPYSGFCGAAMLSSMAFSVLISGDGRGWAALIVLSCLRPFSSVSAFLTLLV